MAFAANSSLGPDRGCMMSRTVMTMTYSVRVLSGTQTTAEGMMSTVHDRGFKFQHHHHHLNFLPPPILDSTQRIRRPSIARIQGGLGYLSEGRGSTEVHTRRCVENRNIVNIPSVREQRCGVS